LSVSVEVLKGGQMPESQSRPHARPHVFSQCVVESSIRISWTEGEMKGKIDGKIERNAEIAIEMIRDGEANDKIRKYTGLTDDEIGKLRGEV